MSSSKSSLIVPVLMITVGVGWLLSTLSIIPEISWIWTVGLAAAGLLPFVLSGVDKATIVLGPWFLSASLLSVLRQTGRLELNVEVPLLVIIAGVLMLVARNSRFPAPKWLVEDVLPAPEGLRNREGYGTES